MRDGNGSSSSRDNPLTLSDNHPANQSPKMMMNIIAKIWGIIKITVFTSIVIWAMSSIATAILTKMRRTCTVTRKSINFINKAGRLIIVSTGSMNFFTSSSSNNLCSILKMISTTINPMTTRARATSNQGKYTMMGMINMFRIPIATIAKEIWMNMSLIHALTKSSASLKMEKPPFQVDAYVDEYALT